MQKKKKKKTTIYATLDVKRGRKQMNDKDDLRSVCYETNTMKKEGRAWNNQILLI